MVGFPLVLCAAVGLFAVAAELIHARRVRRVALLMFGPSRRAAVWARSAPVLRVVSLCALAWGLSTLIFIEPRRHSASDAELKRNGDYRHVLLVLDVSPSMRLVDAGPDKTDSRMQRARAVMESFFRRVPLEQFRISVVAVYNGAKPVVVDTTDVEVVRNILGELPMHYAFNAGETRVFDGLEEAFKMARPWQPGSTTVILVSDGDTVPATGMPRKPASVSSVLVVGVGDPLTGQFIDGRQSRQEVSMLRQIAYRLGGRFHNGNEKHLGSTLIADLTASDSANPLERLTVREYALIACGLGAVVLALLPVLLYYFGTRWRPGVRVRYEPALAGGPVKAPIARNRGEGKPVIDSKGVIP
jgi:Ca-activated chloride channel family protein